ncbi:MULTISPECIES: transglycosylase domain-containing protein [Bhargavaea]|uniref:PBP1A family penicillin-binding protein n=1 Tax=Bhargavaea changchunensis TaxID=2134037 RepID=A0ABW2NHC3_9BACL|nr:PBP1A family penicillin-binding protein [Bhargavaea sp. CC-171006]
MSDQIQSRSQRRQQQEQARKTDRKSSKKPGGKKQPTWKKILKIAVLVAVIGFVFGAGLFTYYAATAPELDEESLKDPLASELYVEGSEEPLITLGPENREFVEYEQIPKLMEDAILATEDVRFYKHHGMDLWRLGGAVLANFRDGFGAQGASTLTQQVVKNSFLQNEKTLKRKAQEAWLAFQLERKYEKEEIFEMYFNKVLMTDNIFGFGTAADQFYGKEPEELKLHEAALLAGMPQSPNRYNPYRHPERAEKRRNIVLGLMVQHGKISQEEADAAKAVPVTEGLVPPEKQKHHGSNKYAAFVDMVREELEEHDLSIADGLKIYTTLDPAAQEKVEATITNDNIPGEASASAAVIDTQSGAVKAVAGRPDYKTGDKNLALVSSRSVGSAIKPILDYGPAIEHLDWSTGHTVNDERRTYKGSDQIIRNADGQYRGKMTMRKALYMSQNVPAVATFEEVGASKASEFAKKVGINVDNPNSSSALGGGVGASPLQMAGAYAAFGNGGMYTEPYTINKVVLRDGKTERDLRPKPVSAMKDSTAYMITDILRDVVKNPQGTAYKNVNSHGLDVAGKTGTTNYDAKTFTERFSGEEMAVPDSWFVGYTPEYSIAVWTGHEDYYKPLTKWEERWFPQKAFSEILGDLAQRGDNSSFQKPKSVVEATIEIGTDPLRLASDWTPSDKKSTELFVRGTVPERVSKTYEPEEEEKEALPAPTGLSADYDEAQNLVRLSWEHEGGEDVQFAVSYSVDGGGAQNLTTTTEKTAAATGVEPGKTYTFSVVAKSGDASSAPASVSIQIGGAPEEEQPAEPDENEQEPDENEQAPDENEQEPDENEQGDGGNAGNPGNQNPGQGQGNGSGNQGNPDDGQGGQDNQGGGQQPSPGGPGGQTNPGNGNDNGTGDQGGTGEEDQNP